MLLTPNEVTHAKQWHPNVALAVVSSIDVDTTDHGLITSGGDLRVYCPWVIDPQALSPIGFAYAVPAVEEQ